MYAVRSYQHFYHTEWESWPSNTWCSTTQSINPFHHSAIAPYYEYFNYLHDAQSFLSG